LYFGLLFVFLGSKVETSYAHCGGGYYGRGRGGYGCDDYGHGPRGGHGGYCWGNENNNEG
jgi:hypothetical protein